ncbi:MAG TPA: hypothetical protein VES42_18840 [Pilimelia sp.]|nr:hypothetical protein [Pilimelia sp.]
MTKRTWPYPIVAAAALAAVVAWTGPGAASPAASAGGPWQAYPGAFAPAAAWQDGARVLVPDPGGCYLALGEATVARWVRSAYWRASGDCTQPVNVTSPPPPPGEVLPNNDRTGVVAAVPAHGGGYLVVTRHRFANDAFAYDSAVLHGSPERGWRWVADFSTDTPRASHIGPVALAAVAGGYVAVGGHDGTAVVWTSPDGADWREQPLPVPAGGGATVTGLTTGTDGRLVAVGTSGDDAGRHPVGWFSGDGGSTWRLARMPRTGGFPQLSSVVHTGAGYVAVGGVAGNDRAAALVLTSRDGRRWERDDAAARVGARRLTAATATPDGVVYAVSGDGVNAASPNDQCARAWRLAAGRWTGEDLACHGIPTALAPLAGGGVAAVHWGTLFLRAADSAAGTRP